jgi:hypothetical protein
VAHEEPKRLKAGVLRQSRKGCDCVIVFHTSRLMDMLALSRFQAQVVLSS